MADALRRVAVAHALRLPGLVLIGAALVLAILHGGYAGSSWYPVAVFALALLVVAWFAAGRLWRVPRPVAVGLAAYAAFCLWTYASILWAGAPGAALEGANRALLYLVVLTVVAVVRWPASAARAALALIAAGTCAIAVGTLLSLPTAAGRPLDAFIDGRLLTPLGYANATASFWCIAFWAALAFAAGAARTPGGRAARCAALGGAGLLAQIALLSQSRGAVIAFGVTALLFLALTPRRGPALLALAAVVLATALAWHPLVGVRSAASPAQLAAAAGDARTAIALSAAALALAAGAFAVLAARLPRIAARLAAPRAGNLAALVTVVALAVTALVAIGDPSTWLDARWRDFKGSGYARIESTGSRFTGSLGSGRYDYWRVALDELRAHPLQGIGADNFQAAYLRRRHTLESPRHPHSLAMRLLSQEGLVGTLLFVVFLVALLAAAAGARRRADGAVAAALLAAFAMWFVHAQADWLWAFPALGMLAFALLGIAARLEPDEPAEEPARRPPAAGILADPSPGAAHVGLSAAVVAVALAIVVMFIALAGASRSERKATAEAPARPRAAVADFEQAARLDPLSADPLLTEAVVARRLGDLALARRSLQRALAREPDNWFGRLELALLDALSARRESALRGLARAQALNPRQPIIGAVARDVDRGRRVDPDAVERELNRQRAARLGPVGG